MHTIKIAAAFALAGLVGIASVATAADPFDWPNWRGPAHNNTSGESALPESWSPRGGSGSNLLWQSEALAGRSTPVVMQGRLYTLARHLPATQQEAEKVICADAATGKVLWEHVFNVYLSDVPDTRVAWSSVVGDPETGRVYAQGVCGYFCCLEGETGKVVWQRSLHEELGLLSTYGGRTNFPLIYKDTVITSAVVIGWGDTPQWNLLAKPAHRFMAFDKATGELRWLNGTTLIPFDTTYSTPVLTTINNQQVLVFGSGDGKVWSIKAGTGEHVWSYPLSRRGLNVSPVVSADGVAYTSHSEENVVGTTMGAVVAIDAKQQGALALGDEKWIVPEAMAGKSTPILVDGRLYVVTDRAKMLVYDAQSGELIGSRNLGRVMRGTPVYADGKIYVCTMGGMFYILKPSDDGVEILQRTRLRGEEVNASPVVSHGRVYLTTSERMYCLATEKPAVPMSRIQPPSPPAQDAVITHIQVSPWDVLLSPGEEQTFTVRGFNQHGDLVRTLTPEEVTTSVAASGDLQGRVRGLQYFGPVDGKLQHNPRLHTCDQVKVQFGDLTASARVRIVPPLPWAFDFNGLSDVPLTWVGGRIRYNLREDASGNHYLAKPIELPTRPGKPTTKLGTRSRMWMGSPELANYTIQADVLLKTGLAGEASGPLPEFPGETSNAAVKLPSVGLINSRYTFTLFGPNSEARLYSWCTHDRRSQAAVAMEFTPDKWYTMKLMVTPSTDGKLAKVQAKVWPREASEPRSWTLEFEDHAPNLSGSPGLFGDAKEAEFYLDNLMVTPNN